MTVLATRPETEPDIDVPSDEESQPEVDTEPITIPIPGYERLDLELLEEAQRQIAAPTPTAAMNEALRRLVYQERAKRRAALEDAWRMVDEGLLDFSRFDDEEDD